MFLFVYSSDPRRISVKAGRHKHDQEEMGHVLCKGEMEGSHHALGLGETLKSELRQVEPVIYDTEIPPFSSIRLIIRESVDQRLSNMYRGLRCQAESTTRSTRSMSL